MGSNGADARHFTTLNKLAHGSCEYYIDFKSYSKNTKYINLCVLFIPDVLCILEIESPPKHFPFTSFSSLNKVSGILANA